LKDGIEILDTGENPEAPASREMSDLEVKNSGVSVYVICVHVLTTCVFWCV